MGITCITLDTTILVVVAAAIVAWTLERGRGGGERISHAARSWALQQHSLYGRGTLLFRGICLDSCSHHVTFPS